MFGEKSSSQRRARRSCPRSALNVYLSIFIVFFACATPARVLGAHDSDQNTPATFNGAPTEPLDNSDDDTWIQQEIQKARQRLQRSADLDEKQKLLRYIKELQEMRRNGGANGAAWREIDFHVVRDATYADLESWLFRPGGRYPLESVRLEKTHKRNVWRMQLTFARRKGWMQYTQDVAFLFSYDGKHILIKDETGSIHDVDVSVKEEIVIHESDDGKTKTISKIPARKDIALAVPRGTVHIALQF